jgi:DNA polymerase-1
MQGETETAQTAVCGPEDPWVGYDFNDPFAEPQAAVQAVSGVPAADRPAAEVVTAGVLGFDIETGDADELFTYGSGFVRLTGAITEDGTKVLGDADNGGPEALVEMINRADAVYGHNILGFDGLALAYYHDLDWEAFCAKAIDTEVKARQADPPRSRGKSNADPYDLDHVAAKYGVPGKSDGLPKLKRKYGGYDKIPLDHAEYREYLEADLDATKGVADVLRASELSAYEKREHEILGLMGRMTLNGFKVDTDLLRTRTRQGEEKKQAALTELHERFGVPLGKEVYRGRGKARKLVFEPSKSPLATKEGKAALVTAIQDLTGQPHYPRTETGDLATGQDGMAKLKQVFGHLEGINEFADLVTTVTTTRTVYQTAATYLTKEGRVHPVVSMRQASGRGSVTKPGMTVFGKRNGKHHERDIFVADEGHVVITCDLSQVDMRGIAGHCQDPAYMELFQPGRDAHQEIADMLGISRHDAKARGHGWNYGLGAASMIRDGADPEVVYKFTNGMQEQFPVLCEWRDGVREKGGRGELLDNGFGRLMRCVPEWAYTVAPALMGQGTARDITCEVLLRLIRRHPEYRHYLRTWVHDEFVFSVPEDRVEEIGADIEEAFTWEWRGVPILCDLSAPGASWGDCSAK